MEVTNSNQNKPAHTRRKDDLQEADQRALNWFAREGDITLYPHSPLALADVLDAPEGCLDLVAQTNLDLDIPEHTNDANLNAPTSLQQRRQRKHPRTRANLLTKLNQTELLESCKQIQIENALVKRAGLRQLYLTAGFLVWKDTESDTVTRRAPVLFYPVTLVRKAIDADKNEPTLSANTAVNHEPKEEEHAQYEVRIDSNIPETNSLLRQWCSQHEAFELLEYEPSQPMQDYFAQIAQVISASGKLELQFEVALGNSAPPTQHSLQASNDDRLPSLPSLFNTPLAMAITENKDLKQLNSVLNLLKNYQAVDPLAPFLPNAANEAAGVISNLHEYSKKLSAEGLSTVEFKHLPTLPENIEKWVSYVDSAMGSAVICDVLRAPQLHARHLIRLAGVIELIDKAPMNIDQYKHADLCFSATPGLLQRAKHQAGLIDDEMSVLKDTFVLDKVPAKTQLLSLINELGGSLNEGPDIVDADYFNARRQFMEFSIEKPTNLTTEHRNLLGKLAKVLRFRELFVNNIEYRMALGPGYRGVRTDWAALQEATDYAQEISQMLESESLAASAFHHWNDFRSTYSSELDVLQVAAESLRKLLWICGSEWQNKSVPDVLAHAKKISTKLSTWADIYGEVNQANSDTPAKVLAQFSGHTQQDVLTELSVGETQVKIEEQVNMHGMSPEAVADTIEWLRQASQTAHELELEINAIVEHLQLA